MFLVHVTLNVVKGLPMDMCSLAQRAPPLRMIAWNGFVGACTEARLLTPGADSRLLTPDFQH